MFERFTERARKVIVLAQDEARRMEHNYIGTEHLLLGLLREDEGVAARALSSLNVAFSKACEQVESMVGRGEGVTGRQPPFTPRSKKVLELALREAVQLGHDYIGTEHLLLGLMREPEGIAARVLSHLGADPNKVRRGVLRMLGGDRGRTARNARGARPSRVAHGAADAIRREVVRNARGANPPRDMMFRARVEGLVVQARCGATDEERAELQPLRVDLDYLYEAAGEDDLSGTVDYGTVIEEAAGLLEREEFRLLETGARMVGENVLAGFLSIQEVTVTVTKLRVPIDREVSGVSVEATFYR